MYKRFITAAMAVSLLGAAACSSEAEDEAVTTEIETMPGQDTVNVPTVVPTTDTIVTEVDVDTIRSEGTAASTDTVRP